MTEGPAPIHVAPELLAPAGDWECVRAAVANGADAIYFGLPRFNARLRAHNFTEAELPEVVSFCHRNGIKAYVALNTLVFTSELDDAEAYLRQLSRAGVDALIVQDVGLVRLARAIVPDLPIHASTQMTVTSPEGAEFARELGVERVVLARELSLRELEKFQATEAGAMPLEVFVHGALCVAYSGQCLTSESLGRRSANRGECAQACRMPYELVVDGAVQDLGDKRYLLSPQDLAAVEEIPALLEHGVLSFKIEGRLKSPEYVAAVCQVYRKAIDAALDNPRPTRDGHLVTDEDRYQLEMTFSRGLFTGWMHGVDHQRLVLARFGKKRGPSIGRIFEVGRDFVELDSRAAVRPGDGLVFDTGGDTNSEQGGRVYEVRQRRLFFERGKIDFSKLRSGDRVWKTDDPALNKRLRASFTGRRDSFRRSQVNITVRGQAGQPLVVEVTDHPSVSVTSKVPLAAARTAPLTTLKLREHLGRFGDFPYALGDLDTELLGEVILPIGELNRLRRELAFALDSANHQKRSESESTWRDVYGTGHRSSSLPQEKAELSVLCRTAEQLEAALEARAATIYIDFEDIRRYGDAVQRVHAAAVGSRVILATPRIQKAGEQGFFRLIENAQPDGVLIRNLGAIDYFAQRTKLRLVGDFSLNVANPLSAQWFVSRGLDLVTVSYDLTADQVLDLVANSPSSWFELTLHQHMPMFHMEHCVFAAFMSKGSTFLDCGRPCEKHRVHLRDRVGMEHPLRADVGCRNTLFNAVAQTGASFFPGFLGTGLRHFRIELLEESYEDSLKVIRSYQGLLNGQRDGTNLWRELKAQSQLGVTRGTLSD